MKQLYNRICYRCGKEFLTEDEEGFYCNECFKILLKDFFQQFN